MKRQRVTVSVALIAATVLVAGGCGGSEGHSTTSRLRVSTSSAPSFESAKRACGGSSSNALAHTLGVSTSDPATLAKAYAERNAPPALREQAYKGCYAGLVK